MSLSTDDREMNWHQEGLLRQLAAHSLWVCPGTKPEQWPPCLPQLQLVSNTGKTVCFVFNHHRGRKWHQHKRILPWFWGSEGVLPQLWWRWLRDGLQGKSSFQAVGHPSPGHAKAEQRRASTWAAEVFLQLDSAGSKPLQHKPLQKPRQLRCQWPALSMKRG